MKNCTKCGQQKTPDNFHKQSGGKYGLKCSLDEFKKYLENLFQPGMTWENYGADGWQIDHIEPLASFDLSKREEFLRACHFSNLQPLWKKDHIEKTIRDNKKIRGKVA